MSEFRPFFRTLVLAVLTLLVATSASAQDLQIEWQPGPGTFDLGHDLAQIEVHQDYLFCDAQNTRKLMELMGNITDGSEVGTIVPASESEDWFVVFEFSDVGYVSDADKEDIDPVELLEAIRESNERANEWRRENGIPALHVTRWQIEPKYDEETHNLQWSMLAVGEDDDAEIANHNTRILGRNGYMSVTVVADPSETALVVDRISGMMHSFQYKEGKRYFEFVDGDRVAEVGLAALVTGGAGVAAAKLGLFAVLAKFFAKMWKLLIAGVFVVGAALRRLFGGRGSDVASVPPPPPPSASGSSAPPG